MMGLPAATATLVGFGGILRGAGFRVAPEQVIGFLHAVALLGPRSMEDIRQAALATLAPPPDRATEFEALFQSYFWGDSGLVGKDSDDEEPPVRDDSPAVELLTEEPEPAAGGEAASTEEQLGVRSFASEDDHLGRFVRALGQALPTRRSFRSARATSRGNPDLRRSLREIVRSDGDLPNVTLRKRRKVQRRLLILIDISGSMRMHTAEYLKVAHAAVQGGNGTEVFTFGTGLTRITPSLRIRNRDQALARAAEVVDDWDGGTRIGPALMAFLAIPRFAAFARGAAILILTDGLERGSPAEMETALRRLSARAYRLSLCTPLAADPRYRPRTAALVAVLPLLDDLVSAASIPELTQFILSLARPAPPARDIWREVA